MKDSKFYCIRLKPYGYGLMIGAAILLMGLFVLNGRSFPARAKPLLATSPNLTLVGPVGPQPATGILEVQVYVTQAENLGAFEFDVTYDPALVAVGDLVIRSAFGKEFSCTPKAELCAVALGPVYADGVASTGATTYGQGTGFSGDGVLADLQFMPTGSGGTLTLNPSNVLMADMEGNPLVPGTIQGATITFISPDAADHQIFLPLVLRQ